jgi:DNA polymerase-3 subunit alpha
VDFVDGAVKKSINKKLAVEIFDLLEKFAQYGFNKSHSTAYALVAYQTAWLKTHYPAEFMAANLSSEMGDTDKVVKLLDSAKKMGIEILPPDVNTSFEDFRAINDSCIAYGLSAIKNHGTKASTAIAEYRLTNGEFKTIFDLARIEANVINRKALESLVQAGACDNLEGHRAQQFEIIDDALRWGQKMTEEAASSQESLFGGDTAVAAIAAPALPDVEEWTTEEYLRREKEIIGFYLSGDPLEKYLDDINEFSTINLGDIPEKKPDDIRIGGIIRNVNIRYDKKSRPWAIVELNGSTGKADIFVFNDVYEKTKELLTDDACIFIKGSPSNRDDESGTLKMIASDVFALAKTREKLSRNINVLLDSGQNDEILLSQLKDFSNKNKGRCGLIIHLRSENNAIQRIRASKTGVNASKDFIHNLRELFGQKHVWIS